MRTTPNPYSFNARSYGAACVVNLASPTSSYQLKPTDRVVLVNLLGYEAGGPTILWYQPAEDDFEVQIRNVIGNVSNHNITIEPPAGWTIEDPASIGTFVSSLVFSSDTFESGTWKPDRKNKRLFLYPPAGAEGAPLLPPPSIFLANGTVTVPPGARVALADMTGNGGGGGGGAAGGGPSSSQAGGGGGGGGEREMVMIPVTPGDLLTVAGISSAPGGAGGDPSGSGSGANGTAAADITISGPGPTLLARKVGGSGGIGAQLNESGVVVIPGGMSINDNGVNLPNGLISDTGTTSTLPFFGPGGGGFGGQFANPGGLHSGSPGSVGNNTSVSATATSAPASGGAAGTSDGAASGGSGGGGGGTGGHAIGGAGGAGSSAAASNGTAGAAAVANGGGGGGGGGAGGGSDSLGGLGGGGGAGATGQVTILFV